MMHTPFAFASLFSTLAILLTLVPVGIPVSAAQASLPDEPATPPSSDHDA